MLNYWGQSEEQQGSPEAGGQYASFPASEVRPFDRDARKSRSNSHRYSAHPDKAQAFEENTVPKLLAPIALPVALKRHSIQGCVEYPTQRDLNQHDIEPCQLRPVEYHTAQHRASECKRFSVPLAPTAHELGICTGCSLEQGADVHKAYECPRYSVYQGPPTHLFDKCIEEPVEQDTDPHRASLCEKYPVLQPPTQHQLEHCLRRSRGGEDFHTMGEGRVYPVYAGPDHHVTECTTFPEEGSYQAHELSSDPKHPMPTEAREHGINDEHPVQEDTYPGGYPESEDESENDAAPNHLQRGTKTFLHPQLDTDFKPLAKTPDRSRSYPSAFDYKRTFQWLRGLVQTPEPYVSKLTRLPQKTASGEVSSRRVSAPERSARPTWIASEMSPHPSISDSKVDKGLFMRAVSDLENLLDDALNLANEVSEQPMRAIVAPENDKRPTIDMKPCYNNQDDVIVGKSENIPVMSPPMRESAAEVVPNKAEPMKRPDYRHAVTSQGLPEEYGLPNRVADSSSHNNNNNAAVSVQNRHASRTPPETQKISLLIPQRGSSKFTLTPSCPTRGPNFSNAIRKEASTDGASKAGGFSQDEMPREMDHVAQRGAISQHRPTSRLAGGDSLPDLAGRQMHIEHGISLRNRSHVSLRGMQPFSLARTYRRQSIARDWSTQRKRFVASMACISTALVGILLGIYAGLVPSIQYYIIDETHATVHGNTGCFAALAVTNFLFWPLPLLHGRKPYILSSLALAMPLLFPQALSIQSQRLTNTGMWRAMLIASRTLMGGLLNFHSILTDLFGASLMSTNPHEEVVDEFDARRHGGGMGVWLGIWTWCWIGSLSIGFLIGAAIIDTQPPAWGFYVSIILLAVVLLLNVVCPEVRRSAYRRSVAEVRSGTDISQRLARGEVKMHRVKSGPKWWGEEVYHGVLLSLEMLRQPGFALLTVYVAWIYAQVVLVIVLLGSLVSRFYQLRSPDVGLHVASIGLGAFLAIPFQKANVFSRSRESQVNTNLATMLENRFCWTSHLMRRTVFTLLLPVAGGCYTAVSSGPPIHISIPTIFAIAVGFLSCLAISECSGLLMETFDPSDLSPGMIGRHRGTSGKDQKRTNYSSFPRVTAGFATIHSLAFVFAAGATALGGYIQRTLGQQVTTGVGAGILLFLTVLLLLALVRFKKVRIIPKSKEEEMDKVMQARRKSTHRRASMPGNLLALVDEEEAWKPVMLGNPVSKIRHMNILELGSLSRWQDIRRRNRLVDEGAHLNRAAFDAAVGALDDHVSDFRRDAHGLLHKTSLRSKSSRLFNRTDNSADDAASEVEMDDLPARPGSSVMASPYVERECVMGQTVKEEPENEVDSPGRKR